MEDQNRAGGYVPPDVGMKRRTKSEMSNELYGEDEFNLDGLSNNLDRQGDTGEAHLGKADDEIDNYEKHQDSDHCSQEARDQICHQQFEQTQKKPPGKPVLP